MTNVSSIGNSKSSSDESGSKASKEGSIAGTHQGSIVGLRSTKFTSSMASSSSSSATTSSSPASTNPSSSSPSAAATAAGGDTPSPLSGVPKPKPLPKPRPWSIVGVDRKSGEVTAVNSAEDKKPAAPSAAATSSAAAASSSRKSSVRDMINNMNMNSSAEGTPTEGFVRRKGNSLPRGAQPPPASEEASKASDDPRILKLDDDFAFEDEDGALDV